MEQAQSDRNEKLNAALGVDVFKFRFPVLLTSVLQECSSREDVLRVAIQIRQTKGAVRLREWMSSVHQSISEGDRGAVEKSLKELEEAGFDLQHEISKAPAPAAAPSDYAKAGQKVIAHFSPLLGIVVEALLRPAESLLRAWRTRKFALLSDLREVRANAKEIEKRFNTLFRQAA